ncbi:MAG TPA: threonine-phosphate decarboxylase CobD [Verrucomicrobiae bacterium]|nr:threonine-phosphate decarboxylase CobD [Verrucomicrobiae bacterium]
MQEHGGNLQAARQVYGDLDFLDYSANINPLGPPPGVFTAIQQNLAQIIHYPDPQGTGLKQALGQRLGVSRENLILGNGAVELIYLLAQALKPQKALIPVPAFSEYAKAIRAVDGTVRYHFLRPEDGFRLTGEDLELEGCDILFVCSPNNPTGQLLAEKDFALILARAEKAGVFVVLDESFMDFVEPARQWRAFKYLNRYSGLFVLYSLTKFYAIPGLRLGCGIGSPTLIQRLYELKDPWNVNSLALAAGRAALTDEAYAVDTRQLIRSEREFLITGLSKLQGLKPVAGEANFILVKNAASLKGGSLVDALGKMGILIRSCSNFPGLGDDYFRIAVHDREKNNKLLHSLGTVLSQGTEVDTGV